MTGIYDIKEYSEFPGKSTDTFTVTLSYKSNIDAKEVLTNGRGCTIEVINRSIWNRITTFLGLSKTYKYKVKQL